MPLKNITFDKTYPFRIAHADAFFPRLLGLLGTSQPDLQKGLYIDPCSGIHTFGMQYPVDVLYLDKNGCVVNATQNLKANAVSRVIPVVKSVVELPPGSILKHNLQVGDRLDVIPDEKHRADLTSLKNIFHWPVNGFIALLWAKFVITALSNWLDQGGADFEWTTDTRAGHGTADRVQQDRRPDQTRHRSGSHDAILRPQTQ